jgi:hypothetical protein
MENDMTHNTNPTKTPAQQVQDALTLIGRLYVQASDKSNDDIDTLRALVERRTAQLEEMTGHWDSVSLELDASRRVNAALRADLDGTLATLNTVTAERDAFERTAITLRDEALALKSQVDDLLVEVKGLSYNLKRTIDERDNYIRVADENRKTAIAMRNLSSEVNDVL